MDPVESTVFIPFQPDHRSHVSHLKEEDLVCGPLWRKEGRRREGGRVGRRETQFTCNLCSVSVPAPVPSCPLSSEPRASSKIALPCPWLSLPWTRDHCLLVVMRMVQLAFRGAITYYGGVPIGSDRGLHRGLDCQKSLTSARAYISMAILCT